MRVRLLTANFILASLAVFFCGCSNGDGLAVYLNLSPPGSGGQFLCLGCFHTISSSVIRDVKSSGKVVSVSGALPVWEYAPDRASRVF